MCLTQNVCVYVCNDLIVTSFMFVHKHTKLNVHVSSSVEISIDFIMYWQVLSLSLKHLPYSNDLDRIIFTVGHLQRMVLFVIPVTLLPPMQLVMVSSSRLFLLLCVAEFPPWNV